MVVSSLSRSQTSYIWQVFIWQLSFICQIHVCCRATNFLWQVCGFLTAAPVIISYYNNKSLSNRMANHFAKFSLSTHTDEENLYFANGQNRRANGSALSIYHTDATSFSEDVFNDYITNRNLTPTLTPNPNPNQNNKINPKRINFRNWSNDGEWNLSYENIPNGLVCNRLYLLSALVSNLLQDDVETICNISVRSPNGKQCYIELLCL
jgi:hypothetical protein